MSLKKAIKQRYFIFTTSIILMVLASVVVSIYFIGLQKNDAEIINRAGRQRMLSQRIAKQLIILTKKDSLSSYQYTIDQLQETTSQWMRAHQFLVAYAKKQYKNQELNALFEKNEERVDSIGIPILSLSSSASPEEIARVASQVTNKDDAFLSSMEVIVGRFQLEAEKKVQRSKIIAILLAVLLVLIILGQYYFVFLLSLKEIYQRNQRLQKANERLSEFAQITSHNLRSPVGNLGSLAYFYKDAKDNEERALLFEKFDTVIKHLDETISILVDSLRVTNLEDVTLETLYFDEIFKKTKEMMAGQIMTSNAQLTTDFSKAPKLSYYPLYLESIFQNLISNALKYQHPDRPLKLHVYSEMTKGQVVLHFKDNGLGIDLTRQGGKIFGLHKTFHRHEDAKGIGLFITRNQIHAMGGDISVKSVVNQGTTFTIRF